MSTGIEENNVLNELSIYPNPANDKATISLLSSSNETINYTLYDAQGKLIEEKVLDIHSGINTLEINVHQLQISKGIYFIKLVLEGKSITKKLVVE